MINIFESNMDVQGKVIMIIIMIMTETPQSARLRRCLAVENVSQPVELRDLQCLQWVFIQEQLASPLLLRYQMNLNGLLCALQSTNVYHLMPYYPTALSFGKILNLC